MAKGNKAAQATNVATPEVTEVVVTETQTETAPEVAAEVIAETATEMTPVEVMDTPLPVEEGSIDDVVKTSDLPANATVDAHGKPIVFAGMSGMVEYKLPLGRPSNPNSERQKRLAEMNAKRAAGELKKGRPVVEGSEHQKRLTELATKRAAGGPVQKGRPIDPNSPRQKLLAERNARIAAGIAAQLGRPPMAKPTVIEATVTAPAPAAPVTEQVVMDELDSLGI